MKFHLVVGLASVSSFAAWGACTPPTSPTAPPDGASATREQMLAAQATIRDYNAAVVSFSDCVRKTGGRTTDIEDAVAKLEKVAELFNAELRTYKQKHGAGK